MLKKLTVENWVEVRNLYVGVCFIKSVSGGSVSIAYSVAQWKASLIRGKRILAICQIRQVIEKQAGSNYDRIGLLVLIPSPGN